MGFSVAVIVAEAVAQRLGEEIRFATMLRLGFFGFLL